MSDLVGNPEDRFSHNEAHIYPEQQRLMQIPQLSCMTVQIQKLSTQSDFCWGGGGGGGSCSGTLVYFNSMECRADIICIHVFCLIPVILHVLSLEAVWPVKTFSLQHLGDCSWNFKHLLSYLFVAVLQEPTSRW